MQQLYFVFDFITSLGFGPVRCRRLPPLLCGSCERSCSVFVCLSVSLSTLHSLRRAVWLPCAYAHHDVFVCQCPCLDCFVSCVKVAIIVVTLLFVRVFVVLGVVVCPRVCLACPFVRSALGRRAS